MNKIILTAFAVVASSALFSPFDAMAQTDFIKANNNTALNLAGSYTNAAVPGTSDTIVYNNIFSTNNTNTIGGTLSVGGLRIESTLAAIPTISGPATLTLGSGGLTTANAVLVTLSAPISLSAPQTWNFNNNAAEFRWQGGLTTNGNTLNIGGTGTGTIGLRGSNVTFDSNVIIDRSGFSISQGGSYTFEGANTFDSITIGSNGANSRLRGATLGDFGVASNFGDGGTNSNIVLGSTSGTTGTLEYTGNTASSNRTFLRGATTTPGTLNGVIEVSTVGQTLTLTGNLGSSSSTTNSGWNLGGNGNLTVTSNILDQANTGVTSLNKFGDGVLTLSGASNAYAGTTTVSTGTLLVNGSLTATSSVTVSVGATLGGSGTIAGDTTVNGTLSAGNSPGLLTFNDAGAGVADLTLASSANTLFEINGNVRGTSYDAVDVEGALTLGGTLTLDFGFTPQVTDTFDLFDFTSQSGAFSSVVFADAGFAGSYDPGTGVLSLSAIPEPSTYALLIGGLGMLAFLRRRKQS